MGIEKHHSQSKHIHYFDKEKKHKKEDAKSSDLSISEDNEITLRNKLENLRGEFISIMISECSDIIRGRVLRVDAGNLTLTGRLGVHIIPICSITSIKPMN